MSGPVIPMSTREWQAAKLPPNALREVRWEVVELRFRTQRITRSVGPFVEAMRKMSEALVRDVQPVLVELTKQLQMPGRRL